MPHPKCTSAKFAEAKTKKVDLLERLEELERQKRLALAEMEIDKEEDIEEEETAVRCLKDLQVTESEDIAPFTDEALETFPMDKDEPLQFPDSGEDEPKAAECDEGSKSESKPKQATKVNEWVLNHFHN